MGRRENIHDLTWMDSQNLHKMAWKSSLVCGQFFSDSELVHTSFYNLNYNTARSLWILKKCTQVSPIKQAYSANVFRVTKYTPWTPNTTIDYVKRPVGDLHSESDCRTTPPPLCCYAHGNRYVTIICWYKFRISDLLESNPFHPSEKSTDSEWQLVVFGNSRLPPCSLGIRPHIYTTFLSTAGHCVIEDYGNQECDHHV